MPIFELKSDLPIEVQVEIDRIQAISSGQRTSAEIAYLDARLPYLTNKVISYDDDGLILRAEGNTLPTGYSGFKKGAFFRDLDKSGKNVYLNVGDDSSADWDLVDSAQTTDIEDGAVDTAQLADGAVTNDKLGADAVDGTKIEDDAIDSEHIADDAVDSQHIAAGAIDNEHLAADIITADEIADDAVSLEHLDAGITSSHIIFAAGEFTTAGGDANETITVTDMLDTDIVLVTITNDGASPVVIKEAVAAAGQIDVVLSADPSTDHILSYMVLRAAS